MPDTYKRRYGLDFDADRTDVDIDLHYWKHWREGPWRHGNVKDPHELFLNAMRVLLTHDEFSISPWTEQHVHDWTHEEFIVTWGCGGSCKSNDYGLLTLVDWMMDPMDTISVMTSTTLPDLLQRTMASVIRYLSIFSKRGYGFPGIYKNVLHAVVLDSKVETESSETCGVWGIAVKQGTVEDAVGRMRGRHAKYMRFICDELNVMSPAVVADELFTNLMAAPCIDFKFVGLTNIEAYDDQAGRLSVPVGGWQSVEAEKPDFWRSQRGIVRRHDGRRSPGIQETEKYPHLPSQKKIDKQLEVVGGNADAPAMWKQVYAWPPPTDTVPTVVSALEALKWGIRDPEPLWITQPQMLAGLDPGYGGDNCVLQLAKLGQVVGTGMQTLWFPPPIYIPINASSTTPVVYQQYESALLVLQKEGVASRNFGIDDSSTQSTADVFVRHWGPVHRVRFGNAPSELPVSRYDLRHCDEEYDNLITELLYTIRMYASFGQIRGVSEAANGQITRRRLVPNKKRKHVESKVDYKKRTGLRSCDELDAMAVCVGVARHVVGLTPGASIYEPRGQAPAKATGTDSYWQQVLKYSRGLKTSYTSR